MPNPTPETAPLPPDAASTHDLTCPLCDYNLRGLTDPRCPECGYSFTWAALAEARRNVHPYLFEHHPKRNAWSYLKTSAAGFRPARFWTTLSPAHAIRPRRLARYYALSAALLLATAAAFFGPALYQSASNLAAARAAAMPTPGYVFMPLAAHSNLTPAQWIDHHYPAPGTPRWFKSVGGSASDPLLPALAILLIWPWATALSLLIFRQSMRKARVRPAHVVRCAVYAGDAATVFFLIAIAAAFALSNGITTDAAAACLALLPIAFLPYAAYRLTAAYRHYLRFGHEWATVLASQIVVVLAMINLMFLWGQL